MSKSTVGIYATSGGAGSITANQGNPNTLANAWPVKPTDGTNEQTFNASGEGLVKDTAAEASLSNIDSNTGTANTLLASISSDTSSLPNIDANVDIVAIATSSLDGKAVQEVLNYGAATGALRTAAQIGNASAVADFGAGNSSAQTLRVVIASNQPVIPTGGKTSVNHVRNDYSSSPVTTGAYVQLLASTSAAVTEIYIFDSSGQTLVLATGAAASEVDQIYIVPGGNGTVPLAIAASTRISIKAVSASATVGEIDINFFG